MNLSAPLTDKANTLECLLACEGVYSECTLQTEDAHVAIAQCDNYIHLSMRGSADVRDWINDLDFPKVTTIYGDVHTGFWRSYLSISAKIHARLRELPALPLVIDGHSLGGDQAVLAANDLDLSHFEINRVVTFGGARPADAEFKSQYDARLGERTIRWVNARDIVPRLPFSELGYANVGQEAFLPSTGGLEMNPTFVELLHDDVVGLVNNFRDGNFAILDDHFLASYRARIEAL